MWRMDPAKERYGTRMARIQEAKVTCFVCLGDEWSGIVPWAHCRLGDFTILILDKPPGSIYYIKHGYIGARYI